MEQSEISRQLLAERTRVLVKFGEAWSNRDLDTLMTLVTDDCVYCASVGPEPGQTFVGREFVRGGFAALMAYDASGESREGRVIILGDVGLAEWAYEHRDPSGRINLVRGCDVFEFSGTRIRRKDAFRKCYPKPQ